MANKHTGSQHHQPWGNGGKNTTNHFILIRVTITKKPESTGKDVEQLESWHITGGNVKWCRHCGRVWRFLKKLKTDLPHKLAIPILGI